MWPSRITQYLDVIVYKKKKKKKKFCSIAKLYFALFVLQYFNQTLKKKFFFI